MMMALCSRSVSTSSVKTVTLSCQPSPCLQWSMSALALPASPLCSAPHTSLGPWGACSARNWICPLDDIKELTVKTEMESLARSYLRLGPTRRIRSLPTNQQGQNSAPTVSFSLSTLQFGRFFKNTKGKQNECTGEGAADCRFWVRVVPPARDNLLMDNLNLCFRPFFQSRPAPVHSSSV